MGKWLKVNGEAIYESIPWIYQNDTKTPGIWYTTRADHDDDDRINVYAIVLEYPYDSAGVSLYALGDKFDNSTTVTMLGFPDSLDVIDFFFSRFLSKNQIDRSPQQTAFNLVN